MYKLLSLFLVITLLSTGCQSSEGKLKNVGLLVPDTINDQVWGSKGYKGLLKIQSTFDTEVYYKEKMNSQAAVTKAVQEFSNQGVNLIFGHGSEYAYYFKRIHQDHPNIHFIVFNGDVDGENITSVNFSAHAMGFFGGIIAGGMTETNKIGVIAAYEWQPEVNGFFEGVLYENSEADVSIRFTQSWDDKEIAVKMVNEMIDSGVDVVYPAGDAFNVPVIERLKEEGLYAIGYVSDQADLGKNTVLTSTVQNVVGIYESVARDFNEGNLKSGNLYYDFQEEAIAMGRYSPLVPRQLKKKVEAAVSVYKETGSLPNQ
ncbi:BMP family ABC transporter substrate-binding protein [Bacillus marinisedimentorum]|uniref:BMP family ABC transporter substrate-binding protein n=1 Tax=Bacillus marinisedimentorum TaxID=1821260 RepID=UPI000872F820|nr:BMP family ABC transporter substrate-binding protein [Bacillus marinisedimentorum]